VKRYVVQINKQTVYCIMAAVHWCYRSGWMCFCLQANQRVCQRFVIFNMITVSCLR